MKERSIEDLEADQRSRHEQMRRIDCTDEQAQRFLNKQALSKGEALDIDRSDFLWKHAYNYGLSIGDTPELAKRWADYRMAFYPSPEHEHHIVREHFRRHQAQVFVMDGGV